MTKIRDKATRLQLGRRSIGETRASVARPSFSFDAGEKIVFTTHPQPVDLGTPEAIAAYFDACIAYWNSHCKGEKIYVVVDYDNLTTNLEQLDFYATQIRRIIDECAITIVRYSGGMVQRTVSRMIAIKLHTPSNTYSSRDEAIAVVRGLRNGSIQTAAR